MAKSFLYISVDVETDGPIPGEFSMLSLGAAAFDSTLTGPERFTPVDTFTINLQPLPGAQQDPGTMEWWATQPEAWKAATKDAEPAETAIPAFIKWLKSLPKGARPIFAGYPVGFDFTFIHWYNTKFAIPGSGGDPFGFSGLDIKTLAAAALGIDYHETVKRSMPKDWFEGPAGTPKHNHEALQDAIGQGILLINILDHLRVRY